MCGITGIFNFNDEPVSAAHIRDMTSALAHRGPDGEGWFIEHNIGLGHRRLSILDISPKGAQPMTSGNGEWVITFNGCIYNFPQLKQELRQRGHVFVSTSDTEVIAEGLAADGPAFFQRLNGMFAIGALKVKERKLFLSRDRYGVKPLYYWSNGRVLLFASEIKAFFRHPAFRVKLNYSALNEYFTFQNQFSYHTLFDEVFMLPPANTVMVDVDNPEVKHNSWWDYNFTSANEQLTFEDAKNETERLFKNAVARQMISDVPVGSYLSGGMDSGSVTAIAGRHVKRLVTFTAGFDMSEVTGVEANYDERRAAELTANFLKTEHYEQVINAGDLRWSLPRVVWHLEDPRVGMSYPNYYISRLASKFVKVCLQGTGGDELYGGYPWRYYRVFRSLNRKEFFEQYYGFWQRLVSDQDKEQLFNEGVRKEMDFSRPRAVFERVFTFNKNLLYETPEDHINNSLYFEIKTFLHGLLIVGDKLSMANGLEERFPFLDNDLVEFAQKIPVVHKLGDLEKMKKIDENTFLKRAIYLESGEGKSVLRKAMESFVPSEIVNRKKQGFSAPDESWYRGENATYVRELLLNSTAVSTQFINKKFIEKIIKEHIDQRINHRLLIWSFMNFEWWCRIFLYGMKEDKWD